MGRFDEGRFASGEPEPEERRDYEAWRRQKEVGIVKMGAICGRAYPSCRTLADRLSWILSAHATTSGNPESTPIKAPEGWRSPRPAGPPGPDSSRSVLDCGSPLLLSTPDSTARRQLGDACYGGVSTGLFQEANSPRQVAPMRNIAFQILCGMLLVLAMESGATERVRGRESVVLTNGQARLVVDVFGGAIGEFRRKGVEVNPLAWAMPGEGDTSIRGFGHFLCLDRWGPPSEAEGARGMPYHGEATHVRWTVNREAGQEAEMTARLPKAGLLVRRKVRLSDREAVFVVEEEITNENALGRVFNAVQHPTIGPPFLDADTVVDCNGRRGFAQGGSGPYPEEPSAFWPRMLNRDGESVDLRRLKDDPNPNVVSYAIEDAHGWVTAASPSSRLLLGYVWKTTDYPWVSLWRDVSDGKPAARGLEFGTTGLHQPFPVLVRKGRIWDRPLFEYLDAGESMRKQYLAFLLEVPADFGGVESIELKQNVLRVRERATGNPREYTVSVEGLVEP